MGMPGEMAEAMRTMHPAAPGTALRLVGPFDVRGMKVWRLYRIGAGGLPDEQVGPDCFSMDEAQRRAADVLNGKRSVWAGGREFVARKL